MHFEEDTFYHVYNRSFNHTPLFYSDRNYQFFTKKLCELKPFCKILAYFLMPDHFHLLIHIPTTRQTAQSGQTGYAQSGQTGDEVLDHDQYSKNLSRKMGTILSSYTQAINKQELKTGSLFQPKTKAKDIDGNNHLTAVFHYIHQNPFRAGLVNRIHEWKYSSFQEYYLQNFLLVDSDITIQFLDLDFSPDKFLEVSKMVILDYLISNYIE